MSPPDMRRGRPETDAAPREDIDLDADSLTVQPGTDDAAEARAFLRHLAGRLGHSSPFARWRHFDRNRRRREHAELKQMFADERDSGQTEPPTEFANSLVLDYGFSVDQVEELLDVQRRAM